MKTLFNKNINKHLNIIIVGAGKIGVALIEKLTAEGHDVTIIDNNPTKLHTISNMYDIMGIHGNGASHSVQLEAGIETANLLIAVTGSDELNLLCCTMAKQFENCSSIARVRTPDYSTEAAYIRKKLGLAMIINPEFEAAKEIARLISLPTALEVTTFAHSHVELIKLKVPETSALNNITLSDVRKKSATAFLICAVERDGKVHIPAGNFVIQADDIVSIAIARKDITTTLKNLGIKTTTVKSCMIIGGGKLPYYLGAVLTHAGISVKIIEQNKERCEELSVLLPKAIIINGDGTDEELLREEGISDVDAFIPLTGIDEENIMLTLFAKQASDTKVITKINRMSFNSVIPTLDLGSVIYPRFLVSEAIVAYARALSNSLNSNVETLYHMFEERVEAIEFHIKEASHITGIPLIDLKLKDNLLICFISRNGNVFIPNGNDEIMEGDYVTLVTTHTGLGDIDDILK